MSLPSAVEWHQRLSNSEVQPSEVLGYYRERIATREPQVQGFLNIFDPVLQSQSGPYSIPIAIKDNICVKDHPTSCGSHILKNFRPPYHATVIEKLLQAGVPIVGKTNLDEFGMGSSTENSAFQATSNPWNQDYVPGGSSGGSAAVVAAEEVPWSLGSDTGGSIRLPAAFCGVVGMKPTYGRVSRYGLVAYASSLDQIGPITRNVHDNALLLNLIAGHDPRDSTSVQTEPEDFGRHLGQSIEGMKFAVPREMMGEGVSDDVRQTVEQALQCLRELGAQVDEIELPSLPYSLAAYYLIATSEASSNLARYDGVLYGERAEAANLKSMFAQSRSQNLGEEVQRRIMLGSYALSSGYYDAYYKKAQQVRSLLIREFKQAFENYDALLSPTSPIPAFKQGEKSDDPLEMYLTDIMTVSANLTGIPAMSVPAGLSANGLPVGLQIMGPLLSEARLYQIAAAYEKASNWQSQLPEMLKS